MFRFNMPLTSPDCNKERAEWAMRHRREHSHEGSNHRSFSELFILWSYSLDSATYVTVSFAVSVELYTLHDE